MVSKDSQLTPNFEINMLADSQAETTTAFVDFN